MRHFRLFCTSLRSQLYDPSWIRSFARGYESEGSRLYEGLPLQNSACRGIILEQFVRDEYEKLFGETRDPPPGKNGVHQSPYDFMDSSGMRVQVKSAIVYKNVYNKSFRLRFRKIKHHLHDKLLLASYYPDILRIHEWDGKSFLVRCSCERGDDIGIESRAGMSWSDLKNVHIGSLLAECSVSDIPQLKLNTTSDTLYAGASPFNHLSAVQRGLALEDLAMKVYNNLVGPAKKSKIKDFDFENLITKERIEVKSRSLKAEKKKNQFRFHFSEIQCEKFDKLILVFHFPDHLEFWMHDKMRQQRNLVFYWHDGNFARKPGNLIHILYF